MAAVSSSDPAGLLDPMAGLIDWADRRYSDIHAARVRFDSAPV
jgi:hypothetical protein